LGFAQIKLRHLQDELHKARTEEKSIEYLGQKIGEILSACRECFDYCAHDISEAFVTGAPNQIYFPFTMESLAKAPWPALKISNPAGHEYLEDLSKKIAANDALPGTIFGYKRIREVNTLVNDKKHDRITKILRPDNASTLVKFGNDAMMAMSPVFPFDGAVPDFGAQVQAEEMVGNHPDIQINYVPEFLIEANNWEAGRYCWHVVQSSWRVLDDLYATIFGTNRGELDPEETTKPPEQKAFESLVKRAGPVVTRLGIIGLFDDEVEVRRVDISFEGDVTPKDADSVFIADYFRDVFFAHGWNVFRNQFDEVLRNGGLVRAENEGFPPRYMEITVQVNAGKRTLTLPSGEALTFTRAVWGLLTKFRHKEPDSYQPSADAMNRAAEFFGLSFKTVVGTTPIGMGP